LSDENMEIIPYEMLSDEEKWFADLADSIGKKSLEREVKKPQKKSISEDMLEKYKLFAEKSDTQGLNPDSIFLNSNEKRSLIREVFNYTKLKTPGGRTPLDECSDSQVGQVFRDMYHRGRNQ
jgi:hypothetical protein